MRFFKRYAMYYSTDGGGGAGVSGDDSKGEKENGNSVNAGSVDELQKKISELEKLKNAGEGENSKLKKELASLNKKILELENAGKTKEQLDAEEKERIQKELQDKINENNIMKLQIEKSKLVAEHKISEHFVDFINLSPEMTENDLKIAVKNVSDKQEAFKNALLKEYSITSTGDGKTKTQEKDFVDKMLENVKNKETDLLKF